ncbi:MAG: ABC transporter permease [Lachnospiraceae bacterium]|nr:ABC transporter permease [Lachnospiraceae bacterium]
MNWVTLQNMLFAAVVSGTPILFGTLGEIINEKAGHLNLGVQGMMAIGGCAGFMAGYFSGSLTFAIIASFIAGSLASLIYAFLTVTMMANQNVTGLALTTFGVALANFIGKTVLNSIGVGTLKLPENLNVRLSSIVLPSLSQIPVIGKLFFSYNVFVYLAVTIAIIFTIYLHRTKTGRNLRAIGENPASADAAGINVVKYKYLNLLMGGGICGIGGAYASMMVNNGVWIDNNICEFGWIAVALVIFASWNPSKAILGAFLFGLLKVLRYYMPSNISIPNGVYDMLPFLMTAFVLVITSIKNSREKSQPMACGLNYYREER